jgi:hypothetical protein
MAMVSFVIMEIEVGYPSDILSIGYRNPIVVGLNYIAQAFGVLMSWQFCRAS